MGYFPMVSQASSPFYPGPKIYQNTAIQPVPPFPVGSIPFKNEENPLIRNYENAVKDIYLNDYDYTCSIDYMKPCGVANVVIEHLKKGLNE